ncbi:hypothetical protein GCM10007103_03510 [Salinimicrobium marinum]|uniref:Uncharacterized protein n=1 Tax=Salinimicrobium marinum TaxID=680283 RepID=A0A918S7Y1_9FLAO|nr:hypothetical protein [Salinimicrobium marinum]GHA25574.1 hypothetical protein GCM10007103_03510 [Salinimicrobium marinum]
MKKEIENYLMDHFEGRGNDYHEQIEVFEINDEEIRIETVISVAIDLSESYAKSSTASELKNAATPEVISSGLLDSLGHNYVCGFYCDFFKDLDYSDYLLDCDIVLDEEERLAYVDLPMEFVLSRAEIEKMYFEYKKCA